MARGGDLDKLLSDIILCKLMQQLSYPRFVQETYHVPVGWLTESTVELVKHATKFLPR